MTNNEPTDDDLDIAMTDVEIDNLDDAPDDDIFRTLRAWRRDVNAEPIPPFIFPGND